MKEFYSVRDVEKFASTRGVKIVSVIKLGMLSAFSYQIWYYQERVHYA